jgi:putative transposase
MYHLVCPTKYRRLVILDDVDAILKGVCLEISIRYEIEFLEIGCDRDHVHFLIQSVPTLAPSKIVQIVKSLSAAEIFRLAPSVKKHLWGGSFWSSGYYINTVSRHGNEATISNYVASQGRTTEYKQLHVQQLSMF